MKNTDDKRRFSHKMRPIGNAGTEENPYVIAYMEPTAFDLEITGTKTTLHHGPGFRHAEKYGSIEVEVHFRRWFDLPEHYINSTRITRSECEPDLAKTLIEPLLHMRRASDCVPFGLKGKSIGALRLAEYALSQVGRGFYGDAAVHYLVLAVEEFERAGRLADFPVEFWEELLRAVEWLGLIEERKRITDFVGLVTLAVQYARTQPLRHLRNARRFIGLEWRNAEWQNVDKLVLNVLELAEHCINNAQHAIDMSSFFRHCILAVDELEKAGNLGNFPSDFWQELLLAVEWLGLMEHRKTIIVHLN